MYGIFNDLLGQHPINFNKLKDTEYVILLFNKPVMYLWKKNLSQVYASNNFESCNHSTIKNAFRNLKSN